MYLYPKMGPSIMVHLLPYSSLGNISKLTSETLAIRRPPKRFRVGSTTSRFANVLFANFWSRFAYVLGQFLNCFCLISGWKNEVYTLYNILFVSWLRERSIYKTKCSFPFLAEQQIDISERAVCKTTRDA